MTRERARRHRAPAARQTHPRASLGLPRCHGRPGFMAHANSGIQASVPAIYPYGYYAAEGGLMAYGVDNIDLCRRAATYVDRILGGARVIDLPVQFPTKFEFVVNLKTAKALGLEIPQTVLALADEVIE
jgi:ABC-type uncharacterized transport system substrate-binding protein